MTSKYDWLDSEIDRLQAEKGLSLANDVASDHPTVCLQLLQMAAQLKSLRPGAADPTPSFLADLRARVLAACEEGVRPLPSGL